MKLFTANELVRFFKLQMQMYDVQVPIKLHDGTRSLGMLEGNELALHGGALPMKPTGVFSPYLDLVLTFDGQDIRLPEPTKPIFVVGFTEEDVACLEFIDRFFSTNYSDEVYFNKRNNAVVVCVSGKCGTNAEFLKIAGGNCDIELIFTGENYIALGYTAVGKDLIAATDFGGAVNQEELISLQQQSRQLLDADWQLLHQASRLILENKVPDKFWISIANRCIACTACTLTCPTCTCFDVYDRKTTKPHVINRWRLRDSCQLDGFMREASGHNPMAKEFLRTRRRIHHKLAADVARWGHITCFLCGRCDQVCPSNIGIKSVCRELVENYG